jgi:hypothetical protein
VIRRVLGRAAGIPRLDLFDAAQTTEHGVEAPKAPATQRCDLTHGL